MRLAMCHIFAVPCVVRDDIRQEIALALEQRQARVWLALVHCVVVLSENILVQSRHLESTALPVQPFAHQVVEQYEIPKKMQSRRPIRAKLATPFLDHPKYFLACQLHGDETMRTLYECRTR
jgi:hypothetical protein